jgi:hypothetical protein
MTTADVEHMYQTQIQRLAREEQLRLVAIIVSTLAQNTTPEPAPKRSIIDLRGLGKEIWEGIDAQEYINKLRDE